MYNYFIMNSNMMKHIGNAMVTFADGYSTDCCWENKCIDARIELDAWLIVLLITFVNKTKDFILKKLK